MTELGRKAYLTDEIKVDGKLIVKEDKVYFVLYKPTGYLTTAHDDLGRRTVMDLMQAEVKKIVFSQLGVWIMIHQVYY